MSFLTKLTATISHWFTTTEPAVVEAARWRQVEDILWREELHTPDPEYKQYLRHLVGQLPILSPLSRKTQLGGRPTAMEVEEAMRQVVELWPNDALWLSPLRLLTEKQQQPGSLAELITDLSHSNWVTRFVARQTLAFLGGEALPALAAVAGDDRSLQRDTVMWLLRSIEADTAARLGPHFARLVCSHCLVRYYPHEIWITGVSHPLAYYGCRACGHSREFFDWPGQIVTVLDSAMSETYVKQDEVIRGNWLKLRSLFDCNRVEIIQAGDEDVERLAVQVGNDTDELRQPRYAEMTCVVACQLSENTQRILQHTFGQVERESPHE